jgi:aspartate aminotransferase-like enzyme
MQQVTEAWASSRTSRCCLPAALGDDLVRQAGDLDVPAFTAMKAGETISNGYGELKGKTFRIGHMGDHTEAELAHLLELADEVAGAARL